MIDYNNFYKALEGTKAKPWLASLPNHVDSYFANVRHGLLPSWQAAVANLPKCVPSRCILAEDVVKIGTADDATGEERSHLEIQLKALKPWRKGPFAVFGVDLDAEWRSDWKWRRVARQISPLTGRLVLDVGCGNGYFSWRMLGAGAKCVVGIDPLLLNVMQFQAIRALHGGDPPVAVLPMAMEDVQKGLKAFDTVFSMGVLYHRRSPIDHLLELKEAMSPGGELVLETLVIDGDLGQALVPEYRYAGMRNVWFIPSPPTMLSWLKRCGFVNARQVDCTATTGGEQRTTGWSGGQSLADFLDPSNSNLTCEGLPAPKRAIFIAETTIT